MNIDTDELALDERAHGLWGVPEGKPVTFENLSARILPEDLDRVRAAFKATQPILGAYEIDFRILHSGDLRWDSTRGQGENIGIVERVMFGVFLNVTERKQAAETRETLAGKMTHRIKNLFAIVSALTAIAARSAATTTEMAHDLTQHLNALGRAHDLVRPSPGGTESKADLGDLLTVLLAPYGDRNGTGARVHIAIPAMRVGEVAVTTLVPVMHELATNSIKYGALSAVDDRLDVSCDAPDGDLRLVWTERGGPPVAAPDGPAGFGSKLVAKSMAGQLGGSVGYDWSATGLVATMRSSKARLAL